MLYLITLITSYTDDIKLLLPISMYHRIHTIPYSHRFAVKRLTSSSACTDTSIHRTSFMGTGGWSEHSGRIWSPQE